MQWLKTVKNMVDINLIISITFNGSVVNTTIKIQRLSEWIKTRPNYVSFIRNHFKYKNPYRGYLGGSVS